MGRTSRQGAAAPPRFHLGAVMVGAVLVVVGCGGDGGGSEPAAAVTSASTASPTSSDSPPCEPGSDAERAGDVLGVLETTNTTDQLGTTVSWTNPEGWYAAKSEPGILVLKSPDPPVPVTRTVVMLRDAELMTTPDPGDDDAGDLDADLDALARQASDLEVSGPRDVTVGGAAARVADVRTVETGTENERPMMRAPTYTFSLHPDDVWRLWVVDQDDQHPLVVLSNALREDVDWLDGTAEEVIASIELGDPVPLDIAAATACQEAALSR